MNSKSMLPIVLIAIASALSARAQQMWPLMEGTQELQLSGSLDWDSSSGDRTELKLGYGYFLAEGVEVGPRVSILDQNNDETYSLDAYLEYHYSLADNIAPYAGFSLGYISNDRADDSSALGATISFGCKFFMVEDLALDFSFDHTQTTGDVFVTEDSFESHRSSLNMGLRFFY